MPLMLLDEQPAEAGEAGVLWCSVGNIDNEMVPILLEDAGVLGVPSIPGTTDDKVRALSSAEACFVTAPSGTGPRNFVLTSRGCTPRLSARLRAFVAAALMPMRVWLARTPVPEMRRIMSGADIA